MPNDSSLSARSLGIMVALRGGAVSRSSFVSNWQPYCDNPITVNRRITSREAHKGLRIGGLKLTDEVTALEVSIQVPCRRCAKCLQWRQMKWRERAIQELGKAKRTWFVTLTFSAIHLAGVLLEAKGSTPKEVEAAAYPHVQRYIKRLRKIMPDFRYLIIYERGEKSGRSHYHMLLHEHGSKPITKQTLETQWRSFVHARLVSGERNSRSASYITKYATKSFDIRPRASLKYGKTNPPQKPQVFGGIKYNNGERVDDAPRRLGPHGKVN